MCMQLKDDMLCMRYIYKLFTMLQMLKEIAFGENNAENKLYSLYIPFPKKKYVQFLWNVYT